MSKLTLKLSKSKAINPSTKKMGYRTTVKSNGKADMDTIIESASKNTTMHKAELRMAFELALDVVSEALTNGQTVELKGIGTIGFSCSGAWTETADEQKLVEHKIGVAFYPSQEVNAAVQTAKTSWTKDGEGEEPSSDGDNTQQGGKPSQGSGSSSTGTPSGEGDDNEG
ncbi:MAG TPA: hypothetical protein DDW28_05115 [Prevotella sp.]|nr:hypothetical protein [Candidatus Segatella violae]